MKNLPITAAVALALFLTFGAPARAFEPYTHNYTGDHARTDALDGFITILGRDYPVRPKVVEALSDWPEFYDAGVIGPDVYPDLLYGWNLIHTSDGGDVFDCETLDDPPRFKDIEGCVKSGNTGDWLKLVLERAWQAQSDARYSAAERSQILAFAYGFLTHAAGDLWAHTLVNDFAQQLWPATSEVLTDSFALSVALRHKAVEAYIGDATPLYDGNPDRTLLSGGDISDTATPHRAFGAPRRFLFDVLINPSAATPAEHGEREATIGFFLDLRAAVVQARNDIPRPVADTLRFLIDQHDDFNQTFFDADADCSYGPGADDIAHDTVACPLALISIAVVSFADRAEYEIFRDGTLADSAEGVLARYLENWVQHIDEGLANWGDLSLALNRAYFDPQVRRDLQNRPGDPGCGNRGPDDFIGPRADCEDAVSPLDVIVDETNDFVNQHLLSMLGAPPLVGEVRGVRQEFRARFDAAINPLVNPVLLVVNPLIASVDRVRDEAREHVRQHLEDRFGIDVDDIEEFSKGASHWLNLETVSITTPQLGTQTFNPLFEIGDHEQIDAITGLDQRGEHHVPLDLERPNSGGLDDSATFDDASFAPLRNTITLAKLLLLDASALDRVLGDILVAEGIWRDASAIQTYQQLEGPLAPSNVMVEALSGTPWLRSITSDHSWRTDAKGADFTVFDHVKGGTGQFPLWESCVLRPAFRVLFRDWENGMRNFPDLGDIPSPDPASNPTAPHVELTITGRSFNDGDRQFVGHDNQITLTASDESGFRSGLLGIRYRVRADGSEPGEMTETGDVAAFSIEGLDGLYFVEYQSQDPCHTFENEDADASDSLPPGPLVTVALTLAHIGTEGNDRLSGSKHDDILLGLGGRDRIIGRGGNDEIRGGPGDDVLRGGRGDDMIVGEDGNDRLSGGVGDDVLLGGDGEDRLKGGAGEDELDGGAGDDRLNGGQHDDDCADDGVDRIRRCERVF